MSIDLDQRKKLLLNIKENGSSLFEEIINRRDLYYLKKIYNFHGSDIFNQVINQYDYKPLCCAASSGNLINAEFIKQMVIYGCNPSLTRLCHGRGYTPLETAYMWDYGLGSRDKVYPNISKRDIINLDLNSINKKSYKGSSKFLLGISEGILSLMKEEGYTIINKNNVKDWYIKKYSKELVDNEILEMILLRSLFYFR